MAIPKVPALSISVAAARQVADVEFVRDSIKEIAPAVLALEKTLKDTLGPIGAAIAAMGLASGGPTALATAFGVGSAVGISRLFPNTRTGQYVDALQSASAANRLPIRNEPQ